MAVNFRKKLTLIGGCITQLLLTQYTHAAIVMKGTRIIFQSNEQESSIEINNKGEVPSLVQTWIDQGNIEKSPTNIQVPFVLSPPIFRIDGNKRQILRIIYTGEKLPEDRESIFWLNILEIPPKNSENNTLQFTYRSRIKLFFRPASLPPAANDGIKKLEWNLLHENNKYFLEAKNSSPFFVSLVNIKIKNKVPTIEVKPNMVAPFSSEKYELEEKNIKAPLKVEYKSVNDFGGITTENVEINEVKKTP